MKRLLSILIILSLILSISGCKKPAETPTPDPTPEEPADVMHTAMNYNGVSITEYQIVCDKDGLDYNLRAAEYIQSAIKSVTGHKAEIVDDSVAKTEHEIVVGETSREISAELDETMEGVQFSMLTQGGTVALEGNYFVIAAAAYYFVDTYVKAGDVEIADATLVREPIVKEAKNYILLIGDGMGVYQTLLFDYLTDTTDYSDGESLFYGYMLPNHGFSRTNSFSGTTDSAAGGTALSTGYKTVNGYVGIDRNGNNVKLMTELASELGKASAVMSTETQTGATPSSFSAHAPNRDDSSIIRDAQAALTQQYGTVIECGFDYYTARYMKTSVEKRITDTLAKMDADSDGFFLMYEEAHIDKHSHDNDMGKTFEALIRFNQAIARFMEYAFYNPDTVVIITADHETGDLRPAGDGTLAYNDTEHSSANVPVFAWGQGTEFFNGNTVENIEIAHFISSAMGDDSFGDRTGEWVSEIYPDGYPA